MYQRLPYHGHCCSTRDDIGLNTQPFSAFLSLSQLFSALLSLSRLLFSITLPFSAVLSLTEPFSAFLSLATMYLCHRPRERDHSEGRQEFGARRGSRKRSPRRSLSKLE